VAFSGNVDQID